MILLLEINIRRGLSVNMDDRYVKSDGNKKIFYTDANILKGQSMSLKLPYFEINF